MICMYLHFFLQHELHLALKHIVGVLSYQFPLIKPGETESWDGALESVSHKLAI